jgi:hypothetical protein
MTALLTVPDQPQQWRVGIIGYGEVGRILAEDLRTQGLQVSAYDSKLGAASGEQAAGAPSPGWRRPAPSDRRTWPIWQITTCLALAAKPLLHVAQISAPKPTVYCTGIPITNSKLYEQTRHR